MKATLGLRFFLLAVCSWPLIATDDLDKVLSKYYQAMGGLEKLRGLKSLRVKGTIQTPNGISRFLFLAKENKCRFDLLLQDGGDRIVAIFDGRNGWEINPVLGTHEPKPLDAQYTRRLQDFMDLSGPLVDWEKKGNKLAYVGLERVENQEFHHIKIRNKLGMEKHYFLDPGTFLPVMILQDAFQSDKRVLFKIVAFETIDGIKFIKTELSGKESKCCHTVHGAKDACGFFKTVEYQEREVNPQLGDHLFRIGELPNAEMYSKQ